MSLEGIVHQDAAQVGMSLEVDPEHVEAFALQPVRRAPYSDHAVDPRIGPVDANLDADAMRQGERVELIDNVETRFAIEPIDSGQVGEEIELEVGLVAQCAKKIVRVLAIDSESLLVAFILRVENFGAEPRFD